MSVQEPILMNFEKEFWLIFLQNFGAVAVAVFGLAFGTVLGTSVNYDLHLPFAPRILIHGFIENYSNYNSV